MSLEGGQSNCREPTQALRDMQTPRRKARVKTEPLLGPCCCEAALLFTLLVIKMVIFIVILAAD